MIGQVIFIHLYELYIQSPESIDGVQSHPTSSNRRNSIGPAAETLWKKRVLMVVREESRNVLVILAIHMRFVWWPKECGSGPTEPPPPPPPLLARTLVYLRPPKSTGETLYSAIKIASNLLIAITTAALDGGRDWTAQWSTKVWAGLGLSRYFHKIPWECMYQIRCLLARSSLSWSALEGMSGPANQTRSKRSWNTSFHFLSVCLFCWLAGWLAAHPIMTSIIVFILSGMLWYIVAQAAAAAAAFEEKPDPIVDSPRCGPVLRPPYLLVFSVVIIITLVSVRDCDFIMWLPINGPFFYVIKRSQGMFGANAKSVFIRLFSEIPLRLKCNKLLFKWRK